MTWMNPEKCRLVVAQSWGWSEGGEGGEGGWGMNAEKYGVLSGVLKMFK
jgi:hypothetical protein